MPARALLPAGLFGWHFAYLEGRETARQSYNTERAREQATRENYQVCLTKPTIEEALTCYRSADNATQEDYRSYSDLSAQWQSAQWTKAAAWTGAIVGVLTLIAAGLAAWFARGAIPVANRIHAQVWVFYDDVFGHPEECYFVGTRVGAYPKTHTSIDIPARIDRFPVAKLREAHREICEPFRDWSGGAGAST